MRKEKETENLDEKIKKAEEEIRKENKKKKKVDQREIEPFEKINIER